jgi:hypothetical protein
VLLRRGAPEIAVVHHRQGMGQLSELESHAEMLSAGAD